MNTLKTIRPLVISLVIATLALGCTATGPRVTVTKAPGTDPIPATIAVYPLLTTHPVRTSREGRIRPLTHRGDGDRIYLAPPAESELRVTMHSQLFSDLLAADLTYEGFKLKQLTLEGTDGDSDRNEFFVSMDALKHLREDFGLQAVLLGNVYFVTDRYDPSLYHVRAAYVKVVDVATLDVICHVSVRRGYYGSDMEEVVAEIAAELAAMSTVTPIEETSGE
jgi:hypothetical protein